MKKLAIITTHPIQYNAPWFRLLAERKIIQIKVFYTWSQVEREEKFDPGFGKNIEWDIPLLEGYDYSFVKNISKNPGSKTYTGIDTPSLIDKVIEWGADAVLVFGWKFKSHLKAIKYFKNKIPVLFRGDSTTIDDRKGIKEWLRYRSLKHVYNNIDYSLYTGSENKKYFLRSGLKDSQLVYVPHAIDNKRFKRKDEINIPDFPKIQEDKLVFLFAGKIEEKKNPELLLQIFHERIRDAVLVMVGNGPMESYLKKGYGDAKNIYFIDFQNQQIMPAIYQKADVFVLPSKGSGETWGLAVNEAMAAGKPVLVSNRCGCAIDLVEEGVNGYTFKSDNANDLEKKIRLMIERKEDLKEMGERARGKIQNWGFENIVIPIENLVNEICK